jgi:large subunit ribosomal protein L6
MPITVPNSVTIDIDEDTVRVKGPKGELSRSVPRQISITREDGLLRVERGSDEPPSARCTA